MTGNMFMKLIYDMHHLSWEDAAAAFERRF
jgi:hypothetical protein